MIDFHLVEQVAAEWVAADLDFVNWEEKMVEKHGMGNFEYDYQFYECSNRFEEQRFDIGWEIAQKGGEDSAPQSFFEWVGFLVHEMRYSDGR